ncbi:MAG: alpha/beta fold hydrolase [Rhodospirillaceae bacterium]|nr:MAG: alpha/beta fold hydrolase [Rhodospirillaceae bacterium]
MKLRNPFILLAGAALGSSFASRLDMAIITGITAFMKPIRAWAAAEIAEGDLDRWHALLGLDGMSMDEELDPNLHHLTPKHLATRYFGDRALLRRAQRVASRATLRRLVWESTLFSPAADAASRAPAWVDPDWAKDLQALEKARRQTQRALHGLKPLFLPYANAPFLAVGAPPASLAAAEKALAGVKHRPRLDLTCITPGLERSLAIPLAETVTYWLRWQADSKVTAGARITESVPTENEVEKEVARDIARGDIARGDIARAEDDMEDTRDIGYARVIEPANAPPGLPAIVICHGLGVEYETSGPPIAFARSLARRGLRIVMPEAPGHGRRRRKGLYGGEAFLRGQPVSGIRHLLQASAEAVAMIAWCRAAGSPKVALAGSSLGAMTAQLAAARVIESDLEIARPDHLLLVTPTGNLADLAFTSSLAVAAGLDRMVQDAGWTPELFQRWSTLVEPPEEPPIDPAAISMVLGTTDTVTPYEDGLALAQRWQVPDNNLVIAGRGHFTSSIAMTLPGSALDKLARALAAIE